MKLARFAALPFLLTPTLAQGRVNDSLLNVGGGNFDAVHLFRPSGALVTSTSGGPGTDFSGAALTISRRYLTSRRNPSGINVFDVSTGAFLATYDTPQLGPVPGDTATLSDGTIAIVDRAGKVEVFTEAGKHVRTISHSGFVNPFGLAIDEDDNVFVGDLMTPGQNDGAIHRFDAAGNYRFTLNLNFEVGDLAVAPDGRIWASDRLQGVVVQLAAGGSQIGSFPTAVARPAFDGIGLASDGSLFVTSGASGTIYRYDEAGNLLGSFPTNVQGTAQFLEVIKKGIVGTPNCVTNINSTGAPAILWASGSQSAADGNLTLTSSPIPNNFGIFFHTSGPVQFTLGCGYLCGAGNLVRGMVVQASGNVATYTYDNSVPRRSLMSHIGQVRNFQHWYRDPMNAANCGFSYSTSNAISFGIRP
jgi:hypothetical protein